MPVRRLLAALLLAASASAAADEITLRNGDRVSGEIVGKTGDTLVVRTADAGEVFVDWNAIARIATAGPVEVMLRGAGAPLVGRLEPRAEGEALLVGPEGERTTIALREVDYIDPAPAEAGAPARYEGHVRLAATFRSGDDDTDQLYAEAEQNARAAAYRYSLEGKVERRSVPPAPTDTSWRVTGNYDRFLAERPFAYAQAWLEHDDPRDIDLLAVAGAGLGLLLSDTPRAQLAVRAGLYHVSLDRGIAPDRDIPAFGWGVEARYAPWGPRFQLFHKHLGLVSLEGDGTFLRSRTGVRSPLAARFYALAQLNLNWDSRTPPGRESTDTLLLLGLDYAW